MAIDYGCSILNPLESAPIMSKLMSKCAWSGLTAGSTLTPPNDYRVSRKQLCKSTPSFRRSAMCWRTRDLEDERRGFNVLSRDCSWRAGALAVNVPPTSRRSISRPQASRANILPYGSGATTGARQGTAHLLLEVSLPQRFCPDVPRIPGRKGISRHRWLFGRLAASQEMFDKKA
jgi:hypothetical protein